MADVALRSLRFRLERQATWERLEALLTQVEKRSAQSLSDEDMLAIPALYRATLSSLSVARATSLDAALIDYLEALSARAYFFVYGTRSTLIERVSDFFLRGWPWAVSLVDLAWGAVATAAAAAAAFLAVRAIAA